MSRESIERIWGSFRDLTESDMKAAVARLSEQQRAALANGPARARFTCHVCNVLGTPSKDGAGEDDPALIVAAYHEVPKLSMRSAEDQWYGEHANEVYRRCIAIYRAAGWTGEAHVPNA